MRYFFVLALACFAGLACGSEELDWWQPGIIYQIYPRSFKDSDGDGVGDLNGITEMVGYLKEVGVTGVWLSPIYESPGKDFGYDISNYTKIDPLFGNLDDFKKMSKTLQDAGIYLLLDIVPNHSSNEHEWFNKSVNKEDPYTDYYVWHDPVDGAVPNNWASNFDGSIWEWNEKRQQYYLHQFLKEQPDLNYNNTKVIDEMIGVFKYWNQYGVHGFRLDAVSSMYENREFKNEPMTKCSNVSDYNCFEHIYIDEQPENFGILGQFKAVMDEMKKEDNITRLMMTESYTTNWEHLREYYKVTSFPFNFFFITNLNMTSTGEEFVNVVQGWFNNTGNVGWANFVVGNHDRHRVATRFGQEMADPINMLILSLKATAITYNGEELGMLDSFVRADQTKDPQGLRTGDPSKSRDPNRGPMIWNATENAGFTGGKPWLPILSSYWYDNVDYQFKNNRSHVSVYTRMAKLRKTWVWRYGSQEIQNLNGITDVVGLFRSAPDNPSLVLLMNVGHIQHTVNVTIDRPSIPQTLYTYCVSSTMGDDYTFGQSVNSSEIVLPPKSAISFITVTFDTMIKINSTYSETPWDIAGIQEE